METGFRLTTPVVLLTFNRPDTTMRVLDRIRVFQPSILYLVSDGARNDKPGETDIVSSIRKQMESAIDWDCEIRKIYATENMGCAKRVASALDIVFENVEMAIILEDDCVPNDSFFQFCEEMLDTYRDEDQIMSICGSTSIEYTPSDKVDYFFSREFGCCGWATWRRAWSKFDYDMSDFAGQRNNPIFREVFFYRRAYWNIMAQFEALFKSDTKFSWAYIFYYCSIISDGYHIYPKYNLISNIGFDSDSTHSTSKPDYYLTDTRELDFPIRLRKDIEREWAFDRKLFRTTQKHGWIVRIKQILGLDINKSVFKGIKRVG